MAQPASKRLVTEAALTAALANKADADDVTPILVLDAGDPVPGGTPAGTLIFYRSA